MVFRTTDRAAIHDVGLVQVLAMFVVATLLTLVFSAVMYLLVEKPAIKLRR